MFLVKLPAFLTTQGSSGFCKVMEINSAIFQDLESVKRGRFFQMAMENFGFCLGKF